MKRLLVILAVLVVLVILGVTLFLATFNADRYRPLLVSKLQGSIGRPVSLERLSLGWRNGIAVQLQGLAIAEDAQAGREPLIHVDSASAIVRLLPLLRKDVQVASIVLERPRIHVARDANGRINLLGLAAVGAPAASGRTARVGEAAVSFNIASLRIEDGVLHWTDAFTKPPADLWIKKLDVAVRNIAPGRPMDLDVKGSLAAEVPNLRVRGRFTPPSGTQPGSVEHGTLTIESLPLERLLPSAPPGEPQLQGKLTLTVQGGAKTLEPSEVARSISGTGTLKLDEPKVVNLNVLRVVFERISMLPGLVQTLEARLPPAYQAKLTATDTILKPIALSVQVEDGTLRFDDLRVRTETFGLNGTGRVDLDGTVGPHTFLTVGVNIRATLVIDPALSAALIEGVKELQALTNADGEMEIPLAIQGQAPQVAVLPDLNYLATKLIVTKARNLLGTFLEKALEKNLRSREPTQSPGP